MCPLCLSALGWLALGGGGSAVSVGALFGARKWKGHDHGDNRDHSSDREP
jgi:hypothetical protein